MPPLGAFANSGWDNWVNRVDGVNWVNGIGVDGRLAWLEVANDDDGVVDLCATAVSLINDT